MSNIWASHTITMHDEIYLTPSLTCQQTVLTQGYWVGPTDRDLQSPSVTELGASDHLRTCWIRLYHGASVLSLRA